MFAHGSQSCRNCRKVPKPRKLAYYECPREIFIQGFWQRRWQRGGPQELRSPWLRASPPASKISVRAKFTTGPAEILLPPEPWLITVSATGRLFCIMSVVVSPPSSTGIPPQQVFTRLVRTILGPGGPSVGRGGDKTGYAGVLAGAPPPPVQRTIKTPHNTVQTPGVCWTSRLVRAARRNGQSVMVGNTDPIVEGYQYLASCCTIFTSIIARHITTAPHFPNRVA